MQPVAKLNPNDGGSKTYIPKNFYRTGGSKMYIPKNFYTRTTYITLLSEKFGGRAPLPAPYILRPCMQPFMFPVFYPCFLLQLIATKVHISKPQIRNSSSENNHL
ncbi:hypothetical protein Hanom_Chr06g00525531 [Helianthus anomalus]